MTKTAALVLGAAVFLRAPLELAPERSASRSWFSPGEPARAAADHSDPPSAPTSLPPLQKPHPGLQHQHRSDHVYFYYPPSDAHLHSLSLPDGHSLEQLIESRLATLEDFGDSAAGRDVLFLLGAEHQSVGDLARAAGFYEAFVSHPHADDCRDGGGACKAAAASLENAFLFRRAHGQLDNALSDADLFVERFANADPRGATRVALAAADLALPRERAERLRRVLSRRLPPAEALIAEVRLGKSLMQSERDLAVRAFRRAERIWERSGGEQMAASPGLTPTAWVAELGRAREALAEARFMEAERRFLVARGHAPPRYAGPATEAYARRFTERRLRPWMVRRMRRIRATERALDRVDELGLSSWSVAAAARRGELYQDLADALRQLDVPKALRPDHDEEIQAVAQVREPVWQHLVLPATAHFEACMNAARETLAYGEWSDRCADGLARHDPRWARSTELRPTTPRVHDSLIRP